AAAGMHHAHDRRLAAVGVLQDDVGLHVAEIVPVMAGVAHHAFTIAADVDALAPDIPALVIVAGHRKGRDADLGIVARQDVDLVVATDGLDVVSIEVRFAVDPVAGVKDAGGAGVDRAPHELLAHFPAGVFAG